jgi:hypothetical protein
MIQTNTISRRGLQNCETNLSFVMSMFRLSVHLHGTTILPMGGFSQNFILEIIIKICREESS